MLKDKGKKLFLLTNSPYYFVDGGMRFLLEVMRLIIKAYLACVHKVISIDLFSCVLLLEFLALLVVRNLLFFLDKNHLNKPQIEE